MGREVEQKTSLYQLLFEQATIGMGLLSLDGRFRMANHALCRLLGYTHEEMQTLTLQCLMSEDDYTLFAAALFHIHKRDVPQPLVRETSLRCKTGTYIQVKLTLAPLHDADHGADSISLLVEDHHACTHAEVIQREDLASHNQQKLIETAYRLKIMFGKMGEYVIVFDLAGVIVQMSHTPTDQLFGSHAAEYWIGKPYTEPLSTVEMLNIQHHPICAEHLPFRRALRGEAVPQKPETDIIVRLPGQPDKQFGVSAAPVHNRYGHVIGGACVFCDVTEQRQRQRHTQQTLNALLTIVDALVQLPRSVEALVPEGKSAPPFEIKTIGQRLANVIKRVQACTYVGVIVQDPDTGLLQLIGLSGLSSEGEQQARDRFTHATLADYFTTSTIEQLHTNTVVSLNLQDQPPTQSIGFGAHAMLVSPIFTGNSLTGVCLIGKTDNQDIYNREEIALAEAIGKLIALVIEQVRLLNEWATANANELALQEANRRFDAFMGIASHELRTPLTTIKGNVQLAMRRLDTICRQLSSSDHLLNTRLERVKHPLEYAVHRVNVQDRMISDLLDASRIRANKFELSLQSANLLEVVRNTVEDVRFIAPEHAILVHLPKVEAVPVTIDVDRIGQVLYNYLGNAIKYSPAGHPVTIDVQVEKNQVRVSVRDEGPGIAPENQKLVWERFYRVSGTEVHHGSGAGLGLGLYLCRTIIEQHHGQVGLQSSKGEGSTFWFTLPLGQRENSTEKAEDQD